MTMYTCRECGESIEGFGAFGNHRKAHRAAARSDTPPSRPRVRATGRRRIEDSIGAPDAGIDPPPSNTGEGSGPEPVLRSAPEPIAQPSRPTVRATEIRISPEHTALGVREAIRDAMPQQLLADLVRSLSIAVSEADGAGPAGYLSEIQSAQVAALLYDATVDLVVTRFNGNVTRFKAGMAVTLILVSKGKVHAVAVRDRMRERRAFNPEPLAGHEAAEAVTDDGTLSPLELAMRRQGAAAAQVGNAERF